jgi:hypothetical protein
MLSVCHPLNLLLHVRICSLSVKYNSLRSDKHSIFSGPYCIVLVLDQVLHKFVERLCVQDEVASLGI